MFNKFDFSFFLLFQTKALNAENQNISSDLKDFWLSFPNNAEDTEPLKVGDKIPDAALIAADNKVVNLKALLNAKKALLVFYRGGWCPYCNTQLAELNTINPELLELGITSYAISTDRPEKITESSAKHKLSYQLLSDSEMHAAKAFGIGFKVDDETVKLYKEKYNIDLEADSGKTHHLLPVPSVFLVDKSGNITFAYSNPDYKVRAPAQDILKNAREMK